MSIITGKGTNDSLLGTLKDDVISGLGGNDTIRGAGGNDVLSGGSGNDVLFSDVFVFEGTRAANGFDTITDYQWWNTGTGKGDKLDLGNIAAFTSKSVLSDFVHFAFVGSNLVMYVDPDGTGSKYGSDAWAQFQGLEDGGNLRLKIGGYTFDVNIPANNHPPEIGGGSSDAYYCIAENTSTVTTVTATDSDVGDTLTYSISGGVDSSLFTINSSTGALSFISAPNFEAPADSGGNNVYDVTVQVSDTHLATDSQNIHVNVNNVAETPVITSNGGGASAAITVSENLTAVTTVVATDGDGTTPTYSIVGGADSALFTISTSTGVLSFNSAPNFEAPNDSGPNNVYDVTVRASDGSLWDDQAIAVQVINANEPPVITSGSGAASIALSISENNTAVTTVTATDVDAGTTLTYSIVGGADSALFSINSSGTLSFTSAPNFEAPLDSGPNNVYDVTVQVSDGALSDTQAIAVTVNNVNEAPVITSNSGGTTAATSVAENSTFVTTVTATDPDASPTLTYSIIAGGADSARFTIVASTGALSFKTAPNFEAPNDSNTDNTYDVTVQVSDGTLTDTQTISVAVTNVVEPLVVSSTIFTAAGVTITANSGDGGTPLHLFQGATDMGVLTSASLFALSAQGSLAVGELTVHDPLAQSTTTGYYLSLGTTGADTQNNAAQSMSVAAYGFGGADVITGGTGADILFGGTGSDTLTGGGGNDQFNYVSLDTTVTWVDGGASGNTAAKPAALDQYTSVEVILDFTAGDTINLGNLSLGPTFDGGAANSVGNNDVVIVQGTYSAGTFTVGTGLNTGADSLVLFDDSSAGGGSSPTLGAIVLVGVDSTEEGNLVLSSGVMSWNTI
jgi:hypothetical protein